MNMSTCVPHLSGLLGTVSSAALIGFTKGLNLIVCSGQEAWTLKDREDVANTLFTLLYKTVST